MLDVAFDGAHLAAPRLGVGRYLLNLCESIVKWHADVRVHLMVPSDMNLDERASALVDMPRIELHSRVPINGRRIFWEHVLMPKEMRRSLPRDVLYHSVSYVVPVGTFRRTVVTVHDVSYAAHPNWYPMSSRIIFFMFSRLGVRRAELVITDSEFSRGEIENIYHVPGSRIVVIPLAADPVFETPHAVDKRRPTGVASNRPPQVLFVGRLELRRRIDVLVQAISLLRQAGTRANAVIVGSDAPRPGVVSDLASNFGVADSIQHRPHVTDLELRELYRTSSALVYLSEYEGFGLPLVEAMSMGTPIIAANASAIPEVVGDAGILVNPGSPQEVSRAIFSLIQDTTLAQRLRERGFQRVDSHYSWRQVAAQTTAAYRGAHGMESGR